ncbi:RDD family protein [Puia dinghuensis]|uniref:RDD family protein n=1 Tax=Puia dinghuensis TaxID=1792502 RepID=A0A8J2U9B8_9BACT|nr:RDD family protein [Puia dinghuensis]GGA87991.1 RDD family protein [Puia dinghuensis]
MLQVKLDTGFNIEVDFLIPTFFRRFFAWVVDLAIIIAYYLVGSNLLARALGPWESKIWIWVLFGLPPLCYHLCCEVFLNGQSIGKKATRIKVISADGGQPSISQYLIRWSFRLADFPWWVLGAVTVSALPWWCSVFLFSGLASILATPYSQRIGDLVAGTILIDTRNHTSWEDTVFTELANDYKPRYPQVMQLSDKDINTLKTIINTVSKNGDYDLSMRIADRIRSKLGIASDQDSLEFLQTLLKDYNYYSTR